MRTHVLGLFLLYIAASLLSSSHHAMAQDEGDDHDHEHGDDDHHEGMELKMIFPTTADTVYLLWTQPKLDESLDLTFVVVGNGTTCGSEQLEEAEELLESITDSQHVHIGDTIVPPTVLDLHLEQASSVVGFPVDIPSDKCLAVFGTHSMEESGVRFLNVGTMDEFAPSYVEPVSTEPPLGGSAESINARGILIGIALCAIAFVAMA